MSTTPNDKLNQNMNKIKKIFVVMSGKGGVGKTTVAVNLAYALSMKGHLVGLLDADLHGPNIAKMLGVEAHQMHQTETGIIPVSVSPNFHIISMALSGTDADQPIIWRGPAKAAVIHSFLTDTLWGELDYLIVDLPPGTGDEPLSICQLIPKITGVIVVTTPQDVAVLDARKSIMFAKKLNVPIAGLIENMAEFACPHCHKKIALFKTDGGKNAAQALQIPFLGSIPFNSSFVEMADQGTPFVAQKTESESKHAFLAIIDKIQKFDTKVNK